MFRLLNYLFNIFLILLIPILFYVFFLLPPARLSIWQGFTSGNRATISILSSKNQKLHYYIEKKPLHKKPKSLIRPPLHLFKKWPSKFSKWPNYLSLSLRPSPSFTKRKLQKNFERIYPVDYVEEENSSHVVDHLLITDLKKDSLYRFVVLNNHLEVVDERLFKTLNPHQDSLVFAVASCMDDRWDKFEQTQMWEELLSFNPQMIFLIGDNVYADKYISQMNMKNFRDRYIQTFKTLALYKSPLLTPVLAVWDDHDYGQNNGGKDFKYKNEMQRLFRDFFFLPFNDEFLFEGHGISFLLKTHKQNFFFLDDRSFRSKVSQGQKSLFGEEQKAWLSRHLNQSSDPSWIISGLQFFGRHHPFESFERDFPTQFKKTMTSIFSDFEPVIFISGDRHLSELLKVNSFSYKTYEITTSPIHAKVYPKSKDFIKDPRHIYHVPNMLNYAVIRSQGLSQKLRAQITLYGRGRVQIFSKKVSVSKN